MHINLIVDLNNVTHTTRRSCLKNPKTNQRKEMFAKELIFKETVSHIMRFAAKVNANAIAIVGDCGNVWRRDIYPDYKKKEHVEDVYYEDVIGATNMIKEFFDTCTNCAVYEAANSEADDVIGIISGRTTGNVLNVIMSSDKDFTQLINEHNKLYSPPQKLYRETDNPEYDLFLKCIRGDTSDNIKSAYPRVREKPTLVEAWEDPYKMQNLMETVNKDGNRVGDLFIFNMRLVDLTQQPQYIKDRINNILDTPVEKNYSEFKVMSYYKDNFLREFSDSLDKFSRILMGSVKFK